MTVRRLLAELDSRELSEWAAYERFAGPLGGARDDIHAAIVATAATNANRTKKDRKAKPADFLTKWDRPPQSVEEQKAIMRSAIGAATRE